MAESNNNKYFKEYSNVFFARVNDRLIIFLGNQTHSETENKTVKNLQVHFLFEKDFSRALLNGVNPWRMSLYRIKNKEIGGVGMETESLNFLRLIRSTIQSVDPECSIRLHPSDKQREALYRMAFKENKNIEIQNDNIERKDDLVNSAADKVLFGHLEKFKPVKEILKTATRLKLFASSLAWAFESVSIDSVKELDIDFQNRVVNNLLFGYGGYETTMGIEIATIVSQVVSGVAEHIHKSNERT